MQEEQKKCVMETWLVLVYILIDKESGAIINGSTAKPKQMQITSTYNTQGLIIIIIIIKYLCRKPLQYISSVIKFALRLLTKNKETQLLIIEN